MTFPRTRLVLPALLLPMTFAAGSIPESDQAGPPSGRATLSFAQGQAVQGPAATPPTTGTGDVAHVDRASPAARDLNTHASPVPEPSTLALAALSAVLLFIVRRRPTLGG